MGPKNRAKKIEHIVFDIYGMTAVNDLEAAVQPDEEGVVGGGLEDVLLGLHPVDVLVVRHQLLLDHLHRVDPLVLLQLHHQHLSGSQVH